MADIDFRRGIDMARAHARLNVVNLARRTGLDRSQLYRYRFGRSEPSYAVLERIADACGVPLSRLIYWAEGGN